MPTQVVPFMFESSVQVRTFTDDQGRPWFCAKDVCDALGYANDRDAVAKHCRTKGVAKRDTLTEGGTQSLTYINEGNLYRLIVKSRKPEAEKFESWIYDEVIPSIRTTGGYSITNLNALSSHTIRAVQIHNSKSVNATMMDVGGRDAIISYNTKNCLLQSGKFPREWKKIGKDDGLPSRQRQSAKDVLRAKQPHVACGMSFSDQMVTGGISENDSISLGKDAQPIFQRMLALGYTPPELLI